MFLSSKTPAKLFLGMALACVITSVGTVGARANDQDSNSIAVSARNLDLRTQSGVASLHHRVLVAAYKVCERITPGKAINSDAFGDCVWQAVYSASTQVDTMVAAAKDVRQIASAVEASR